MAAKPVLKSARSFRTSRATTLAASRHALVGRHANDRAVLDHVGVRDDSAVLGDEEAGTGRAFVFGLGSGLRLFGRLRHCRRRRRGRGWGAGELAGADAQRRQGNGRARQRQDGDLFGLPPGYARLVAFALGYQLPVGDSDRVRRGATLGRLDECVARGQDVVQLGKPRRSADFDLGRRPGLVAVEARVHGDDRSRDDAGEAIAILREVFAQGGREIAKPLRFPGTGRRLSSGRCIPTGPNPNSVVQVEHLAPGFGTRSRPWRCARPSPARNPLSRHIFGRRQPLVRQQHLDDRPAGTRRLRDVHDPVADEPEDFRRRVGFRRRTRKRSRSYRPCRPVRRSRRRSDPRSGPVRIELANVHGFPSIVDERQHFHDGAAMRAAREMGHHDLRKGGRGVQPRNRGSVEL